MARGGEATVEGVRLRCRAHNQFAAECAFGAGFMEHKRHEARSRAHAKTREKAEARHRSEAEAAAADEVLPYLRQLGYRLDEAREAARFSASIPDVTLEDRVRKALSFFRPRTTSCGSA